jgi:hypothetical protein
MKSTDDSPILVTGAAGPPFLGVDLLSGILLTSSNRWKDAHFITWFHGRLGVLKKPNIFVIHENVYEPTNVILFIANPFFQTRVTLFQIVNYIPDRRTFDPNNFLVLR